MQIKNQKPERTSGPVNEKLIFPKVDPGMDSRSSESGTESMVGSEFSRIQLPRIERNRVEFSRIQLLWTFMIVAGCSILFCSKGVIAKLSYAQGADALTVVTLRMIFALPFFAGIAIFTSWGAVGLSLREMGRLALLGFIGYYFSALVNFTGLQYVSVGLERIILFTYPTLVLVFSRFLFQKPVSGLVWFACVGSWIGIVAAFTGELHNPLVGARTFFGAGLIFASAISYAVFLMLSGSLVGRLGAMRFSGFVVGLSCIFVVVHYAATRPLGALMNLPPPVYGQGVILALLGTVAPAILMGYGLKRAGAQKFAIISAIGPVTTFFLAWSILGEHPNAAQVFGFGLTIGCGLAVSLFKEKKPENKLGNLQVR